MKNLTKIFMAVVVAMAAFACASDPTDDLGVELGNESTGKGETIISLSMAEVRTYIDKEVSGKYPMYWSDSDKISVNGVTSSNIVIDEANPAIATFTIPSDNLGDTWNIAYPAAKKDYVFFEKEQTHTKGTFGKNVTTMYASCPANESVVLKPLIGILKIGFTGSGEKLVKAQISTIDRKPIAGNFAFDFAKGEILSTTPVDVPATDDAEAITKYTDANESNVISYSFGDAGLSLSSEVQYIHVAVPAGNYDELYITLYEQGTSGNVMYATVRAPKDDPETEKVENLAPGQLRFFKNPISYAPNATLFVIDSTDKLVAFKSAIESTESPLTADAVLVNDVEAPADWESINGESYTGTLYGNGYAIKNLKAPLFGTTAASFKGLHLENIDITTTLGVAGALACLIDNTDAVVEHCSASGKMTVNGDSPTEVYDAANNYGSLIGASTSTQTFSDIYTNVALVVKGTFAQSLRCSNAINDHSGKLLNVTNHGTLTYTGKTTGSKTAQFMGIAYRAKGGMENCVNGVKDDDTKGKLDIGGSTDKNIVLAGLTAYAYNTVKNCHNYADIYNSCKTGQIQGSGFVWYSADNSLKIQNCTNYGDMTFSGTGSLGYIGGLLSHTNASYGAEFTNCQNHGDIIFTSEYSVTGATYVGGFIGIHHKEKNTKFISCANHGDIKYNGTTKTNARFGGLVGYCQKTNLHIQDCTNHGVLEIGGYAYANSRVGGIIGLCDVAVTFNGEIRNKGKIECSLKIQKDGTTVSESNLYIGGIGGASGADYDGEGYTMYNEGDIYACDAIAAGETVGGIWGNHTGKIANVYSFCNIVTKNLTRTGMILGTKAPSTATVTYSCCGGTISTDGGATENKLNPNNYFKYIYGQTTYDGLTAANIDICGYISAINATPDYYEGEPLQISTAEQLKALGASTKQNVELIADIDLTDTTWTPIEGFATKFYGNNKTIKGLTAPLFGTTQAAVIQNVHLTDVAITSNLNSLGALACNIENANAVVSNCSASGTMTVTLDTDTEVCIAGVVGRTTSTKEFTGLKNEVDITCTGKVFNETDGTKSLAHFAGCICLSNGTLKSCENLGNVTVDVKSQHIHAGGVVNGCMGVESCSNGDAKAYDTKGNIDLTVGITGNHYIYISGVASCTYPTSYEFKKMTKCNNYGSVTLNGSATKHDKAPFLSGVMGLISRLAGPLTECNNYGTITYNLASQKTANTMVAGIANWTGGSTTEVTDCHNHGEIIVTDQATTGADLLIGGILNVFDQGITYSNLSNNAPITVSASNIGGRLQLGGIAGRINNTNAVLSGTIKNNAGGVLTVDGSVTGNISLGGIFGDGTKAFNSDNADIANSGNVTFNGTASSSSNVYVGGIAGSTATSIDGARVWCTVTAWGYDNVGMITGSARTETVKATNCYVGGFIDFGDGYGNSGEKPLSKDIYFGFIYGSLPAANLTDLINLVVGEDKCGYLDKTVDDDPEFASVPSGDTAE